MRRHAEREHDVGHLWPARGPKDFARHAAHGIDREVNDRTAGDNGGGGIGCIHSDVITAGQSRCSRDRAGACIERQAGWQRGAVRVHRIGDCPADVRGGDAEAEGCADIADGVQRIGDGSHLLSLGERGEEPRLRDDLPYLAGAPPVQMRLGGTIAVPIINLDVV